MNHHTELTIAEVFESLTGYDQIKIKAHFGAPLTTLDAVMTNYAAAFIQCGRQGMTDVAAYEAAMSLTYDQIADAGGPGRFFASVTEATGKDD